MILHRRLAFGRIARRGAARLDIILPTWLPDARREGAAWVAANPRPSAGTGSLIRIGGPAGAWDDPAAGDHGRDLIDLASFVLRLSRPEAALLVARMTGTHPYA